MTVVLDLLATSVVKISSVARYSYRRVTCITPSTKGSQEYKSQKKLIVSHSHKSK